MFAQNHLSLNAPKTAPKTAAKPERPFRPLWVNRLLGVRPAPAVIESSDADLVKHYPTVEGVSSATAFRSNPR